MANKTIDIADEIFVNLLEPSDTTRAMICFWLERHIGDLNNLLGTSYSLLTPPTVTAIQISPELDENVKSIYKKLYIIYYYDRLIRSNLGAATFSSVLEVDSDGAKVRMVNRNDIAKSYMALKKSTQEELDKLINGYLSGSTTPLGIFGDDNLTTNPGQFDIGVIPRTNNYNTNY